MDAHRVVNVIRTPVVKKYFQENKWFQLLERMTVMYTKLVLQNWVTVIK